MNLREHPGDFLNHPAAFFGWRGRTGVNDLQCVGRLFRDTGASGVDNRTSEGTAAVGGDHFVFHIHDSAVQSFILVLLSTHCDPDRFLEVPKVVDSKRNAVLDTEEVVEIYSRVDGVQTSFFPDTAQQSFLRRTVSGRIGACFFKNPAPLLHTFNGADRMILQRQTYVFVKKRKPLGNDLRQIGNHDMMITNDAGSEIGDKIFKLCGNRDIKHGAPPEYHSFFSLPQFRRVSSRIRARKGVHGVTDYSIVKQKLIAYSKEIGVDKIGFTTAEPFTELKARLYRQRELGYQSGFEEKDIEKRTEPSLLMDGVQSIVAIALAYPKKMAVRPENTRENRRGAFCRASWGTDYHRLVGDCLEKLGRFLINEVSGAKFKNMVDTGELSDRAVAERAGIGWAGKNTNVITQEFGSYVYLGEMLTNVPLPPDKPAENLCGDCTICIDRCPTGAIVQGGQLNSHKCIAFLTQTKQDIPEHYRKAVGNRVYGCDTCQQVCPYNRDVDSHFHEEMEPDPELARPLLKPLLSISNRGFKEIFGDLSGSWRGKKPIQRNAILALGNYKDVTAAPELLLLLEEDPRPVIRRTAVWAVGKMWDLFEEGVREKMIHTFKTLLEKETDEKVRNEMERLLLR